MGITSLYLQQNSRFKVALSRLNIDVITLGQSDLLSTSSGLRARY